MHMMPTPLLFTSRRPPLLERLLTRVFPSEDVGAGRSGMLRWHVFGSTDRADDSRSLLPCLPSIFGCRVMIHKQTKPDRGPAPHDHPWGFWSFVIKGGYAEVVRHSNGVRLLNVRAPLSLKYRPPEFCHRIYRLLDGVSSWTLVVTTPYRRRWGFWTREGKFINRNDYTGQS